MTSTWWVNQGQSWTVEARLGVLWAPLRGRLGQRVPHFERLEELSPGDVMVHYVGGRIVAVSEVTEPAVQSQRPYDPDGRDGWTVRVRVEELDRWIPLAEIAERDRRASAAPGTAFDSDGGVGNGYLFTLPATVRDIVFASIGLTPAANTAPAAESPSVSSPGWFTGSSTDGTRIGGYRMEQPALRRALLQGRSVAPCDVCGRTLPARLLVTAHIKPRAHCTEAERTDLHVAFLACALGCDALYEHGCITVDPGTGMIRSGNQAADADLRDAVAEVAGRRCHRVTHHNRDYFAWHQNHHTRHRSTG